MTELLLALTHYGYVLLFTWLVAEQMGLPLPGFPALLAAGVLCGTGKLAMAICVPLTLLACMIGDTIWFCLGRRYGAAIVKTLCRVSLEPDSCVRKTSSFMVRHGARALVFAKFIPGIGSMAITIAGQSAMGIGTFAAYDFAGSLLYVSTFLGIGFVLSQSIEKVERISRHAGALAIPAATLTAVALIATRYVQRRRFLHDLKMARISPEELRAMLDQGQEPFIVDLRHSLDFLPYPQVIPTAVRMDPAQLAANVSMLPRDREIILYCT
jgi:membrane protein DedA with SNARE-associated domain